MGTLPFDLEIEDIAALADLINEKNLGEICLKDDDIGAKLVIKSRPLPPPMQTGGYAAPTAAQAPAAAAPAPESRSADIPDGEAVRSPIVGTYYSSPSPDKPPFVQVGQKVKKGDIIMIIESMKIMNEIPSPTDGTVRKILVRSGEAVEFDQPVMIIG